VAERSKAPVVLRVINPLSTQLKGYQPKIKQPGCLSRLITPINNLGCKRYGLQPKNQKICNLGPFIVYILFIRLKAQKELISKAAYIKLRALRLLTIKTFIMTKLNDAKFLNFLHFSAFRV
jgi:hypothetical protein